jgi:hypothetical protein
VPLARTWAAFTGVESILPRCYSIGIVRRAVITSAILCIIATYVASKPNQLPTADGNPPGWITALQRPDWWLVIVGTGAIVAALMTLGAIKKQSEIMMQQLSIPHRAYLAIGEPRITGSETHFPIWNYGHISGTIQSVSVEIIVQDMQGKEMYRRDIQKSGDMVVVPGEAHADACALNVSLPHQAREEDVQLLISGTVSYDTGFKGTDTLSFVRVYLTNISQWRTASVIFEIDFSEDRSI